MSNHTTHGCHAAEWDRTRLKWSLASLQSGTRETGGGNLYDDGVFSIGGEHIGWNGELRTEPGRYVSEEFYKKMNSGKILVGDVLLVKDGATIGKLAIIGSVPFGQAAVNEHVFILRTNNETEPAFLFYFLQSAYGQQQIQLYIKGSAQPGLNSQFISYLHWAVPDKESQKHIVELLDCETARVNTLIQHKQRQIELLQERRAALINDTVARGLYPNVKMKDSGVEWLDEIPAHWGYAAFRRFITRIEQGWSPQAEQRIAEENEWAVLKVGAVYRGTFRSEEQKALPRGLDPISKYEVREGDLLLTRGNTPELVADACIVPRVRHRLMISDLHYRIELDEDKCLRTYACYWLISHRGRIQIQSDAHGTSNSMVKVSQSHIKSWGITCPPLSEQKDIIKHLDIECAKIAGLAEQISCSIDHLQEYRMAVITAAVTGKMIVRDIYQREVK